MIKLIILLFYPVFLFSNIIIDKNSNENNINITNNCEIFIDSNNSTFKKIKTLKFIKNNKKYLNFGYTNNNIWLKFSITNSLNKDIKRYLSINNKILDNIVLYEKNKKTYIKTQYNISSYKAYKNKTFIPKFELNLKSNETKEFYIKINSISSGISFSLNILTSKQYYENEIIDLFILSLFFGALFLLIIYNSFIYIITKDKIYMYYSFMILFSTLNHLSYTTILKFIVNYELNTFDIFLAVYYIGFYSLFTILFFREFFDLKKFKKINLLLNTLLIIQITMLIANLFTDYLLELIAQYLIIVVVALILINIYLLIKKIKNSLYLLISWGVLFFGIINFSLFSQGYSSFMDDFKYLYEFTLIFEALMFSIILSKKLNYTKLLEEQINTNKILTKELHHRVKNNMQFIVSLYRLKLSSYNKLINNSLNEVESSVQSMSKIYDMLFKQNSTNNINSKKYFENLIDNINNTYKIEKINIKTDICYIDFTTNDIINIGIILNELIHNSYKYAFSNNSGNIYIKIYKVNKKKILIFKDDGVGFDLNNCNNSSGLEIVKLLISKLKGKLEFKNNNGSEFKIIF